MENSNLENLNKLAKLFGADRLISPEEIQQIFTGIVEILATYKKGTESINEDTKSVVNKLLEDVISIHKESLSAVEEKKKELGNDFADKLTELKQMVTSIQEEMDKEGEEPEDDTDDEEEKQALIEEIMAQITLPEVKATIVSGEEIVDKINELPLDDDNKIDWARIKNAPKIGKQTISGSPTVLANAVDLDGSTRQDTYAIVWDAARGRYTHAASGGGSGSGDVTGPASSTDNALARFDGTTGKIIQNSTATLDDAGILSTTSSIISGTNGSGHINLRHQASDASATGQSTAIFADSNGDFKYKNDGNFYTTLKTSTNTADRTYTYPDATGNLALKGTLAANQIAYATDTNTVASLDTATYPSLTELSYVKGVTSAIQTQLNAKGTGSVTSVDVSGGTTGLTFTGGPITTSGTITAAGTLAVANGGTGQTSYTNGQLLIGNTTGNTLTKATLTGTANQVVVTNGGGSITLSTPQDIGTGSTVQFNAIELGHATQNTLTASGGVLSIEGVVIPTISSTNTLTNKRITKRVNSDTANSATPTLNTDNYDMNIITGQTNNITSMTTNLSGTPTSGQTLWFAMTAGSGTPTVSWGSSFEDSTVTAPTALSTTRQDVGFVWNATTSKWRCVAKC